MYTRENPKSIEALQVKYTVHTKKSHVDVIYQDSERRNVLLLNQLIEWKDEFIRDNKARTTNKDSMCVLTNDPKIGWLRINFYQQDIKSSRTNIQKTDRLPRKKHK